MTQEKLKNKLHYNPDSGVFTWINSKSNFVKNGDVAGSVSKDGYLSIRIGKKLYKSHRLAWLYVTGSMPTEQIDHINHTRDDNRMVNLREVTQSENRKNNTMQTNNKSGVTGVCWNKRTERWVVQMKVDGKYIHGKHYTDLGEAIQVRRNLESKHGFHKNHGKDL